jgi:hypothetical protein
MSHPAYQFIKHVAGPMGSIRICTLCKAGPAQFSVLIKRGNGGFVAGNKANGALIQHIKAAHAAALAA